MILNVKLYLPNGKSRTYHTQGWLLANLWRWQRASLSESSQKNPEIIADLAPNLTLFVEFDTLENAWTWLHRPTLYKVPLKWFGTEHVIEPGYKHKMPKEFGNVQ